MSTIYNNGWTLSSDIAAGDSRLHPGCCCVPSRYQAHERSLALRLRLGAVVSFLQGRSPKRALGVLRRDQAAFRPPTTTCQVGCVYIRWPFGSTRLFRHSDVAYFSSDVSYESILDN
jgi:hypothetical protein